MLGASFAGAALAASAAFFASPVAAADVDPLVIKGNHFFYKTNGTEFYIRGVAYQQDLGGNSSTATTGGNDTYMDPLADNAGCDRDIPLMTQISTNTIRVYALDPTKDHTHCMTALQNAGIYLIADLSAPDTSITSDDPQWNLDLYKRYTNVIDAFANYTNVIGFFAGNEVANMPNNTNALAFVKAAVRDTKAYIKQKNYRQMYIGYASSDNDNIRTDIESYLDCGPEDADNIDFFGYNIYSWCDPSNYVTSNYEARTQELSNYTVPAFFAEYGCNKGVRDFEETAALYGPNMTGVWSGGIVYEWFQEANNYGLVSISGTSASPLPDFSNLATALAKVSPTILNSASFTPTNTATRQCPPVNGDWGASPTLPPSPNQQLCDCMVQSLSCVPKGSISDDKQGALFDYICGGGSVKCDGISGNGTTGSYGAYSMCDANSRLAWAMNAYASAQKSSNSNSCDFSGNATTQSPKSSGTCASLVSQVGGTAGTGTSTSGPNAGAAGASSSKSAAGAVTVPGVDVGLLKMGAYVVVAMAAGAGIVLM